MKKFFLKIHLWLSLPFGIVIAVVCITGAILAFENDWLELRYPERYFVKERAGDTRLSPSGLTGKVHRQLPDSVRITGIRFYQDAARTCRVYLDNGGRYFADPYTGRLIAPDRPSPFFRKVMRLHRFLLHSFRHGTDVPWGKWVVGCSTIAFVLLLVSGWVVWFPRNWRMLRRRLQIRTGNGRFRFWHDLHVSGGFYVSFLLLVMALTGLTWSFPWYRTMFYTLFGANPAQQEAKAGIKHEKGGEIATNYTAWDEIFSELERRYPDYQSVTLKGNEASVSIAAYGNVLAADKFEFHPHNGHILREMRYKDSPAYNRARGWLWAVHTGRWGGFPVRVLYSMVSLSGAVLAFTGYYLWIRRKSRQ